MDMLVHIKSHDPASAHVDVAMRLAGRLGARLDGLHTLADMMQLRALFADGTDMVTERQRTWDAKTAAAKAGFLDALRVHAVDGAWLEGEGHASELLTLVGRMYDLVVVAQRDGESDPIDFDPAEETALGSGAPTLVVPCRGAFPRVGARVAIAWNHSREAALALRGAMPILATAEAVVVIAGAWREAFASVSRHPPLDLAAMLQRRGIPATTRSLDVGHEAEGAALLQAAEAWGADLLVMGAFGRSWLRQWLLGGATRHVFRNMQLPVLCAH